MKIIVLMLAALLSFGASASKLTDLNKFGVNQNGNSAKVGAWGSGTWDSAVPISPAPGGWSYAGNYGIPQAAAGPTMNLGHSGDVFFSGTKYPFQAGYQVPATTLVDAIGAIAGGPIAVGLFALPFVLDWLNDAGGRVDPLDPTKLQRTDPTACTVAPCYEYRTSGSFGTTAFFPTLASACQSAVPMLNAYYSANNWTFTYTGTTATKCVFSFNLGTNTENWEQRTRAPSSASWLPSSMDDIAPYMKQTPFDPRVIGEILDKGGDIPFPAPTVTGPTEILGPKTETPNPDGSKTVVQPVSRFTFQGDTITNTTNETTVTIVNVDNSIRSSTTTVTTPVPSTQTPKTEDPCLANPDRIGCSKLGTPVASDQLEKETVAVTVTPVAFAGAATCPGPISFNVAGHQYAVEYTPLCQKLAVLKFLFLAMAGFVAAYVVASMFKV